MALNVEHLILCTIRHNRRPEFPDCDFIRAPEVQALRLCHSRNDRLLHPFLAPLFLDLDLTILGATLDEYDEYCSQIRREYECYSDQQYRQGRIKVLRSFLDRETLFFTPHFRKKLESKARRNIEREIEILG